MTANTADPKPDMIVSNGRIDFLVHRVTPTWIYGIKYRTENRGDVDLGPIWVVKVTHETWRESMKECSEVAHIDD